jgi:hypothetical protein
MFIAGIGDRTVAEADLQRPASHWIEDRPAEFHGVLLFAESASSADKFADFGGDHL